MFEKRYIQGQLQESNDSGTDISSVGPFMQYYHSPSSYEYTRQPQNVDQHPSSPKFTHDQHRSQLTSPRKRYQYFWQDFFISIAKDVLCRRVVFHLFFGFLLPYHRGQAWTGRTNCPLNFFFIFFFIFLLRFVTFFLNRNDR